MRHQFKIIKSNNSLSTFHQNQEGIPVDASIVSNNFGIYPLGLTFDPPIELEINFERNDLADTRSYGLVTLSDFQNHNDWIFMDSECSIIEKIV